jgi:hypothetical protein
VVEARVVDGRNRPIAGLGPRDFAAEVDGRPAPIESVTWVEPARAAGASAAPPGATPADGPAPPGRRLVLLFQKDARGSRLLGLLRSTHHAAGIVATLGPGDAAAVLVHDSQLRLHLDWTRDQDALSRVLSGSVLQRWPGPIAPASADSLAALLDPTEAKEAASVELRLRQVAQDTGGVYLKTSDHPDLAIRRVSALLAGHYVVSLERPSAPRGEHRLTLSLVGRRGTVLARSTYVD